MGSVGQKQNPFLVAHPLYLQNAGVEVVVPSLATLLSESALDEFGDEGPALRTVLFDQFADQIVLLVSPRLLSEKFGFVIVGFR
jgi:hypothetical protein